MVLSWAVCGSVVLFICVVYLVIKLTYFERDYRRTRRNNSSLPSSEYRRHSITYPGPNEAGLARQRRQTQEPPWLSSEQEGPFIPVVIVSHPETVRNILRTSVPIRQRIFHLTDLRDGDIALLNKGDKRRRNPQLFAPVFHFDIFPGYIVVNNRAVDALIVLKYISLEPEKSITDSQPKQTKQQNNSQPRRRSKRRR